MSYHDHHFHPLGYVGMVNGLELMDAPDYQGLSERIRSSLDQTEGAVVGQRLNDEGLSEGRLPTRELLDDISSDRPILLYRYCGHIGVANSAALAVAGVDSNTDDPAGGHFDRDLAGTPTGVVRETALSVVSDALTPHVIPQSRDDILGALGELGKVGIGSVTAMVSAGEAMWCGVPDELDTLIGMAADLPVAMGIFVITEDENALREAAEKIRSTEGWLEFSGWKSFADGSLGGHTAAMYEPFSDMADEIGTLRLQPAHALEMARVSLELDGSVAIHAIGDRANDEVLDIFAHLIADGADPDSLRIEHASLMTDSAIERMADLGVTASVQPAFLASEGDWLEKRLGPERMRLAYRFRSMGEAGITMLGGSDCPVEPPDPSIGIEAAVARHGINPDESLTAEQAAALFRRSAG